MFDIQYKELSIKYLTVREISHEFVMDIKKKTCSFFNFKLGSRDVLWKGRAMTAGERKRHRGRGEWASRMHGSSGAGRASSTLRFLPRRPGTCAFWRRPGTQSCAPLQQLLASTRLDSRVLGSCSWRGGALVRSYQQGVCCISLLKKRKKAGKPASSKRR